MPTRDATYSKILSKSFQKEALGPARAQRQWIWGGGLPSGPHHQIDEWLLLLFYHYFIYMKLTQLENVE